MDRTTWNDPEFIGKCVDLVEQQVLRFDFWATSDHEEGQIIWMETNSLDSVRTCLDPCQIVDGCGLIVHESPQV